MSIEAMKQAEKLLVSYQAYTENYRMANECGVTITTLRQAIEQAEKQEPDVTFIDEGNKLEPMKNMDEWRSMVTVNLLRHCGVNKHFGRKLAWHFEQALPQAELAKPEQEPVAYFDSSVLQVPAMCFGKDGWVDKVYSVPQHVYTSPLYTAPPRKPWVGLTGLEVSHYNSRLSGSGVAEEIEAKLRERNT
jgi:hypothetical protein